MGGVITHKKIFVDFFTFRGGKGPRSWLDAHNALSVFGLTITYTGLVTPMALYMPWGKQAAIQTAAKKRQLSNELSVCIPRASPAGSPRRWRRSTPWCARHRPSGAGTTSAA